jgi:GNAT superfamily N-acetyltransferase
MSPPREPVEESVASLIDAWTVMARRHPDGRVDRIDGVTIPWAGVPLPFLNVCVVDSPCADGADLGRRLHALQAHVAHEPHPWLGVLCEAWVPGDWREIVADAGLHVAMGLTGMVAERIVPPRRPPPELALRRVGDEGSRRAAAEINAQAYGLPGELFDCVADPAFWPDDMHGFVGAADGRDVCTTAVFPALGTAYVALVATHPDHHRKGYAEHVMRHALLEGGAALGLERSILHASDAGRPVYAAMGYADTARFALLSTEPPEEH